jgi:hypothetical protein
MSDAGEPDRPGAMRFFAQPRWAPGPHSVDHGMRRRETPAYSELELEVELSAGSAVGVVYVIPADDPSLTLPPGSSFLFATCFGSAFQPLRRILLGPTDDERAQSRFAEEMSRVRPLFMTALVNSLYNDLDKGALIKYDDPSDGVGKNLLVGMKANRDPGADLLDEEGMNTIAALLIWSFEVYEESFKPLDEQGMQRDAELVELRETAGSAAKWLFENAADIATIVKALSG